jgi:hypothetical protein
MPSPAAENGASGCEAVDDAGNVFSYTNPSAPAPPTDQGAPTISGNATEGQVLSEVHGNWSGSPTGYTYQWEDCNSTGTNCSAIVGATNQAYTLTSADVGHTIAVQEIASNAGGNSTPADSTATSVVTPVAAPVSSGNPTISGTPQEGQALTESHGTWSSSPNPNGYAYQWEDCDSSGNSCSAIAGATSQTYMLTSSDVGHTIRVQEAATNAGGTSSPASSSATGVVQPLSAPPTKPSNSSPPVVSGPTTVGQTLTTSTGVWSGTPPISYSYQWARCSSSCSAIGGAISSTYTLISVDTGAKIAVVVTATNSAGSAQAVASEVGPVAAAGPTAAQVKAALSKVLKPSGKAARLKAIVKAGGYSFSFTAPSAGMLVVGWYASVKGKKVLVASASVLFRQARKATVKLKLTGKGRQLLKSSKRVKITAKATFTPTGGTTTSSTKTTALKR